MDKQLPPMPESERSMYPKSVFVVYIKDEFVPIFGCKRVYIDAQNAKKFVEEINNKNFSWLSDYQLPINTFQIEGMKLKETKDDDRYAIKKVAKNIIPIDTLSLNDTIKCLQNSQQQKSLTVQ